MTSPTPNSRSGPLKGIKVVEIAGIGPGPMCAMLMADLGASVLRINRTVETDLGVKRELKHSLTLRNRDAVSVDLKQAGATDFVLDLIAQADGLIDPFRPGVLERLGLGPQPCLARNPRLVYGRMTGWGQDGPMAQAAGHDLNYIALTGVLNAIGREGQPPSPPLNLLGDYGGGALYLAFGMTSAMLEARSSGLGQVVDAAMFEGAASLATQFHGLVASGGWGLLRGTNYLDGGAPYYDCYPCSDGKWLSVAPIEERFYREFLQKLELDPSQLPDRSQRSQWPALRNLFATRIASKTRDEWAAIFQGSDACVAPVLDFLEARQHPHALARGSYVEVDGVVQPAPAPRFSRTPANMPGPPRSARNEDAAASLAGWMSPQQVAQWQERGLLKPL